MKFVSRDHSRTEEDDFKLNVEPQLGEYMEAVPVFKLPPGCYIKGREDVIGWEIQSKYE